MISKVKKVAECAKTIEKMAPVAGKIAPTVARVVNPAMNTIITGIEVAKITINTLGMVMSELLDKMSLTQMSLDDIAQAHDEPFQACIANEKRDGHQFAAGKLFIDYVDNENFQVSYELYFQNDEGKFFRANGKTLQSVAKFLTSDALKELQEEQHIEYPVEEDVAQ